MSFYILVVMNFYFGFCEKTKQPLLPQKQQQKPPPFKHLEVVRSRLP